MRFEREVNIYGDEVILKRFTANETSISVIQGEISAIISESELVELVDSSVTMYSKLASAIMDIDSLELNFSDLTTKYNTVSGQYTALDSKVAQYQASVDGLSANVSQISQNLANNYSTTTAMNSAIDLKINQFSTSVSETYATKSQLSKYSTIAQMNSAINQKANEINASVSATYATKSALNTANGKIDDLEEWKSEASLKITDSAIIATVISSSSYENSVESLIEQNADSIRLKADRISWDSTYSSMTSLGTLTCRNATIEGTIHSDNGDNEIYMRSAKLDFIRDGVNVGIIGTGVYANNNDLKGLVFNLKQTEGFMSWGAYDESDGAYTMKWYYFGSHVPGNDPMDYSIADTINAGCDINMRGFSIKRAVLEAPNLKGFYLWGDMLPTFTFNVITEISYSEGELHYKYRTLKITNGIVTSL